MNQNSEKLNKTRSNSSLRLVKNAKSLEILANPTKKAEAENALRLYDNNHKRFFNFTEFVALGADFARAVGECFIFYSSTVVIETAQGMYSAVLRFFRWLISNNDRNTELIACLLEDYEKASAHYWEEAFANWQQELLSDVQIGPVSKNNLIKCNQSFFKNLIFRGVVPKIFFIPKPKNLRSLGRPTRCLAEAVRNNRSEEHERLIDAHIAKTKKFKVKLEVTRDFLTVLLEEKGSIAGTEQEHAKELMKVNAERLALIRNCAVKDFQKWHDHWLKGQELLKICDLSFEEIQACIETRNAYDLRIEELIFPKNDSRISLARLLRYFQEHPGYKGRVLHTNLVERNLVLRRQVSRFGGISEFQAYLFPHCELIVVAATIFLCDTGANVSVAWSLPLNCLEDSNEPGYKLVTGIKMRAGGKLIVSQLPVKDRRNELSCVQALEIYREISASLRKTASPEKAENLFLYIGWSGGVENTTNQEWARNFKKFIKRHSELSHLDINSNMIRPSVLMQVTYAENSGIAAAGILADHKSLATTSLYVNARYPLQIIWERMIREFQGLFQAVAIHPIEGAAEKLGLSAEQVSTLLREANRTGLGVACLDPSAGIQPNTSKNEACTELQNCPGCSQRFVVATVENLKDLILWNHHLKKHQDEWEKQRPERWEKVWMPWLAFTEVAIQSASRGRTLIEFTKANAIAKTLIANNAINFPPLW